MPGQRQSREAWLATVGETVSEFFSGDAVCRSFEVCLCTYVFAQKGDWRLSDAGAADQVEEKEKKICCADRGEGGGGDGGDGGGDGGSLPPPPPPPPPPTSPARRR